MDLSYSIIEPVSTDGTGVPGSKVPQVFLLVARSLGSALNVGGDIPGHVEQHHVVA